MLRGHCIRFYLTVGGRLWIGSSTSSSRISGRSPGNGVPRASERSSICSAETATPLAILGASNQLKMHRRRGPGASLKWPRRPASTALRPLGFEPGMPRLVRPQPAIQLINSLRRDQTVSGTPQLWPTSSKRARRWGDHASRVDNRRRHDRPRRVLREALTKQAVF